MSEMTNVSRRIAEEAESMLQGHELEFHEGSKCLFERINLLAFLAHRLGVTIGEVPLLIARLIDYEEMHNAGNTGMNGHVPLH